MSIYKDMYLRLFNRVTDAVRALEAEDTETALDILKEAQQETENLYTNGDAE